MDDVLFTVTDPRGKTVICTADSWHNHILSRHPYLSERLEIVKNTITGPTYGIFGDAHHPDRQVYYYRQSARPRYMKVIVRDMDTHLIIITAFETDSMKSGEKLLWTQSDAS